MSRKIAYLINPISGSRRGGSLQSLVATQTESAGLPYSIFPTVASGDYRFLENIIREEGFTDVVICGGDGTVNNVVGALRHLPIQFGIIPCGSGNGLALTAGIPLQAEAALNIILKTGRKQAIDAFTINNRFACMLCGVGFDAAVAHRFAEDPRRGLTTYIRKSLQHFFDAPLYHFDLSIRNKKTAVDAWFISIANSNQFGNRVTIAPQANLSDGLLDVVVAASTNKLSLIWDGLKQVAGFNALDEVDRGGKGFIYFQTDEIKIKNRDNAPLHIDGEPVETADAFHIKIIRDCFWLWVP